MIRARAAGEESWLDRNRDSESPRRNWRDEERNAPAGPACSNCKADDVETDEWGLCEMCRPTDEEHCEAWEERVRERRPK